MGEEEPRMGRGCRRRVPNPRYIQHPDTDDEEEGEDVDEELDFYMDDDDGDHALAACHTHT